LIAISRFGGESCNSTRDFVQFFDAYYYNCFTYHAPKHSENYSPAQHHHPQQHREQSEAEANASADDDPNGKYPAPGTSERSHDPGDQMDSDDDSNLAEGLENGWSAVVLTGSSMLDKNDGMIRVIPGTHEYLSPMSSSEGVRVVIHPPDTEPYPHTEGFDVPPGYSATFGVKV
jgi:hypothetical protein